MLRKQDQVARSSGRLGLACSTTIHDHDHAQTRPQLRLKWPGATHFSSENHYAEASALSIQPNGKLIRGLAALVMILALVLPVSPGFAAEQNDDGEVQAAHLASGPGGNISTLNTNTAVPPVVPTNFATYDSADCPPTTEQPSNAPKPIACRRVSGPKSRASSASAP